MTEILETVLGWLVPAAVVFGTTALAVVILVWVVRRVRRGPRARAAAVTQLIPVGVALVELDDAVTDLDLEVELSGALYGGEGAASLRRARMTAHHARDQAFADYRTLSGDELPPAEIRRLARRVQRQVDSALEGVRRTQSEHAAWVGRNVAAADHIDAAQRRLDDTTRSMGDPRALVAELSRRFDASEWTDAAAAAESATTDLREAARLLAQARSLAADPTATALPVLAAAERSLRSGAEHARTLERSYTLITQASTAVAGEIAGARDALRAAMTTREGLEPAAADRLGSAVRDADRALTELEGTASRRPSATIDALARIRGRLDLALGDARSAQQRLRGARSALPGTLAAARGAIARADSAVSAGRSGADARVRLAGAEAELAAARQQPDPVAALDAVRRAIRLAEDAKALADYHAMEGPR